MRSQLDVIASVEIGMGRNRPNVGASTPYRGSLSHGLVHRSP
jgi:hypothetical protein